MLNAMPEMSETRLLLLLLLLLSVGSRPCWCACGCNVVACARNCMDPSGNPSLRCLSLAGGRAHGVHLLLGVTVGSLLLSLLRLALLPLAALSQLKPKRQINLIRAAPRAGVILLPLRLAVAAAAAVSVGRKLAGRPRAA